MTNIVNYNQEYINTILSYFAYVDMDGKNGSYNLINQDLEANDNFIINYKNYLIKKHGEPKATTEYNNTQDGIDLFVQNFIITKQVVTTGFNGFSAITYQLKNDLPLYGYVAGESFVAYRGTEAGQSGDIVTDIMLATSDSSASGPTRWAVEQIFKNIKSQEVQAVEYLDQAIKDSTLKLNITGHSLGGYLGVRSLLTYQELEYERFKKEGLFTAAENTEALRKSRIVEYINSKIRGISTFNGAGLSMLDGFFIGPQPLENLVNNFYSIRGLNVTAGNFYEMISGKGQNISVFEHLGPRLGTATENDTIFENHSLSLLLNSIGVMSTLETLIKEYPEKIKDINGNEVSGQDARLYLINQLIMNATYEERDEGKALYKLGQRIIEGFGLKDNLYYNTKPTGESTTDVNYLASFINLKEFFVNNPSFKISVYDNFKNISLIDSNNNRSAMYSLLNDLSYVLEVPSNYSEGIFDRSKTGSALYDVSLYSQDYINKLKIYNHYLLDVVEKKLYETLPYYYTIGDPNVEAKYAFVIKSNKYGFKEKEIFYINANESDIEQNLVQYIYFKNADEDLFINKDNSIVYDTALDDRIIVSSSGNTIYSFNGYDYITVNNNTKNNTIIVTSNTDSIQIVNNNRSLDDVSGLTINFKDVDTDLKIQVDSITKDFVTNKITIKNGVQLTTISGSFNIETNNKLYPYQDVVALAITFPEMFMDGFIDLDTVVNESFINDYIVKTKEKFNKGEIPPDKLTSDHAKYIIDQLALYTLLTSDNKDTAALETYVNSKIHEVELSQNFETNVNFKLVELNNATENIEIKNQINEITKTYSGNNYINLEDAMTFDTIKYYGINGVYLEKNTKVYVAHTLSDGRVIWKWEGEYAYDRIDENGNKIEAFYGNTSDGVDYKKYMKENILIKQTEEYNSGFYGTDGSDVIIGDEIYGQSIYYKDDNGNVLESSPETRQNGNDILIGKNIKVYSGDNLIIQNKDGSYVMGGSGNDTIISESSFAHIYTDKENKETSANKNTVILLDRGTVYSSKGVNTITISKDGSYVYATSNDTVYMNGGTYYSHNLETQAQYDYDAVDRHQFYNNYTAPLGDNKIYITGNVTAYMNLGDEVFINGNSEGTLVGLGKNKYHLMNNYEVYSGGNSEYVINGESNTIHFGKDDTYEIKLSNYNKYYVNDVANGYYHTIGKSNIFFMGSAEYILDLNGSNTTVNYLNDNQNLQTINVNEVNKTDLNFNNKSIDSLNINNQSELNLKDGSIRTLKVQSSSGGLNLESMDIDNFNINSRLYVDINVIRNNNIKNIIANNVNFEGYINKIESFIVNGSVTDLKLDFNNNISTVYVDGYIEKLDILNANITSFNYNKKINEKGLSSITLTDSSIDRLSGITNFTDIYLSLNNTNINSLALGKLKNSRIDSRGLIQSIEIDKLDNSDVSFSNKNAVLNKIVVKDFDSTSHFSVSASGSSLSIRMGSLISSIINPETIQASINSRLISIHATRFNDANFNLNGERVSFALSGTNINQPDVSIVNGEFSGSLAYLNNANIANTKIFDGSFAGITKLLLDNVEFNNFSDVLFGRIEDLIIKQDVSLIITKDKIGDIITDYKFQYVMDYKVIIGNKTYNKNDIEIIRNQLGGSITAYAILNDTAVEYIGLPTEEPESDIPYTDNNGILQGSYNNDIFNITNNSIENILKGNSGDDTYNFQGYHYKPNTIMYDESDGLDTITANQYVVLKVNLNKMEKSKLSFTYEKNIYNMKDTLNIFYKGVHIFKVKNLLNMNFSLQTADGIMTSYDIDRISQNIIGTDQNDIITGTRDSNYIYAGKGDDIISLQGYGQNEIYYNLGDGHDTINAPDTSYTIMLENTINKDNVTYATTGGNGFNVLLNEQIILTISDASRAYLRFLSSSTTISGTSIMDEISAINGTDESDVINVDTASIVKSKGGNDIINVNNNNAKIYAGIGNDTININYAAGGSTYSTVYYEMGEDFTQINLSSTEINKVNLQMEIPSGIVTYAYDVNNHNTLNIYLAKVFGMPSEKIIAIENYRQVISENLTEGRANVYRNDYPVSHRNTIDYEAEANYKKELNNLKAMSSVAQNINSLTEIMSSYESLDESISDINIPPINNILGDKQ